MSEKKKIYFACDGFGEKLKDAVKIHIKETHPDIVEIVDFGNHAYYDAAASVGKALAKSENKNDMGALFCGTGMGVGIMANKFPGVRAATCENLTAAKFSRAVNDANVLCLGQLITTTDDAKVMADEFFFKQKFISHPLGDDNQPVGWWDTNVEDFLKTSMTGIEKVEKEAKDL